jgi:peptide/nickel transport system ATP-binding protein
MLDVSVRAEILELMANLKDKLKISYLYITHDLSTARYVGDDIAIMREGRIVEIGNIDRVLLHPNHAYTQALLEAISEPDPDNLRREKNVNLNL